jgi:hypothetical protein
MSKIKMSELLKRLSEEIEESGKDPSIIEANKDYILKMKFSIKSNEVSSFEINLAPIFNEKMITNFVINDSKAIN